MACYLVAASVGLMTTLLRKRFPEKWHIDWLNAMVWGSSLALTVEHIAHGEIVPWPPFLTAMASAEDTAVMLNEMATVGIPMTLALIAFWAILVFVYEKIIAAEKMPAVRL
ncbi:MAG: hypothetical protein QXP42_03100 [Candidatus Micrarchaeia archaeon]